MLSNNVKDDGVTDKEGKGARDPSILAAAKQMGASTKANGLTTKKNVYSKENLLPDEILNLISYKQTYQALEAGDDEALSKLLSSFVRVSMQSAYRRFEHIEQKREKKLILKAHVYLDALITLNRMSSQI